MKDDPVMFAKASCGKCFHNGFVNFSMSEDFINRLMCPKCNTPQYAVSQLIRIEASEYEYSSLADQLITHMYKGDGGCFDCERWECGEDE